ncbi:UDP-N-acetylglucosamine--N-acetylmuramyl-(pentapeptide) pyrophosphoryl-undecaprenol N-acetylglucosamine transferase [Candidatus Roizmanbacteria bacterium]|nr:UDP-N-acetylglucosamine--N-acetylmuramyl-(pentapeptide) pyrophosphoryl-undecaprenol N-acetylglucosamine transferase [Candidatus Roizmanbacteria bacterium]
MRKLLITGGHLTPALAVIDELEKSDKQRYKILFVGRKYANYKDKELSLEFQEIKKRKISFFHLKAGRFTRFFSFASFVQFVRIPFGFYRAYKILRRSKPDCILSFGGYLGLPIVTMGALLRIPSVIHEQTMHPGLANRISARFAKTICISFPSSRRFFPKNRTVLETGNPLRSQLFEVKDTAFELPSEKPVLTITGGSLGAHSINVLIEAIVPKLLDTFCVIHQTGNGKEYDDYARLLKLKQSLPPEISAHYMLAPHFSSDEIGAIYAHTDIAVSRAGANTFFEMVSLKIPTIFIPLPWSANNEQRLHATEFKQKGTGEVFEQTGTPEELLKLIQSVYTHQKDYESNFSKFEPFYFGNAAARILEILPR